MLAGINMFWALLRLILARAARLPRKHYYYYYHFGGYWGNKHWKNDNKFFFTSAVRKGQQTLKWLLDFDWLHRSHDYLILTFYWFISAGKNKLFILARKMRHNAWQSDNNICFYFDALFLFTRETISDCLSRDPAWNFLVWFKRRTTIADGPGVSILYPWIFRCFEARVAHILFRNHCVAFPPRCHFDYTKLCIKFGTWEVRRLNRRRSIVELPM